MRPSRVLQRWQQGRPALCTMVHLLDPAVTEMVSLLGFDCIWLDLEHHPTSVETASQMMRGARIGVADVMARPGKGEFMRMGRLLDAGAQGILYPRCESVDEAADVVRWARFAPRGERGFDGTGPDCPYGFFDPAAYVASANANTFIAIQVESPAAVGAAGEMAAIDGVDMVFFGPADYSILADHPGEFQHPDVEDAAARACRATRRSGKHFGTLCFDDDHVRRMIDLGATFIAMGSDINLLRAGFADLQSRMQAMGL